MTFPTYVGRYEVRSEIARGSFATVMQAWDDELESLVAIKILHAQLAQEEQVRQRFVAEARLLRRVHSPNVIAVHDIGRLTDGRPYLVLDYADRGTLAPRLAARGELTTKDTQSLIALVDALADGLGAIHNAGLVHRDVKPANILLQSARIGPSSTRADSNHGEAATVLKGDERVVVGDLGIAKDISRNGSFATIVGGTPLYLAPEQNDPYARITVGADVYSATAIVLHFLTGRPPPPHGQIQTALAIVPFSWQAVIGQGMDGRPERRFEDIEAWRAAIVDTAVHEAATDAGTVAQAQLDDQQLVCPYKGLAAYQFEDADLFCGREGLVDELVRRVQLQSVLVVGGSSGSGKSSLVRAGLLPALKHGAVPHSAEWRLVVVRPGHEPIRELAARLPELTNEELAAEPWDVAAMARSVAAEEGQTLVFVDQFEELFTLTSLSHREAFLELLAALTDPADGKIKLVIAVRADFYEACAKIPWLARRITGNQVLVGPMTGPELRRAITEPARRVGLFLERELVDAIVADAGSEASSLPLVAHALVETWVRRRDNSLTLDDYRAVGGVVGAISQTADAIYERSFTALQRRSAKALFLRLVTPGEGVADTRRVIERSEIAQCLDADIAADVVDSLAKARLFTVDTDSIQIAHEALLRSWPLLRRWIEESRDDLRVRQKIDRAAVDWISGDEDPDLLYRGTPLLTALEWSDRNPDHIGVTSQRFLAKSSEVEALARSRAAAGRRRLRRLSRIAILALSLLTLGATVASIVAFQALREAQRNEEIAGVATRQAESRFASALGSAAFGHVEQYPQLGLILAAEAIRRSHTDPASFDARAAMLTARAALAGDGPFLRGSPISAGDAVRIALSPEGSLLAVAQRNGTIRLVDTLAYERAPLVLAGHTGGVRDVEFGPFGRYLVSGSTDGSVRLWEPSGSTPSSSKLLGTTGDVVMSVCIDPSGQIVAAASDDGTVRIWRLDGEGHDGRVLAKRSYGFDVVEFSPDGKTLFAVHRGNTIHAWNVDSGESLGERGDVGHEGYLMDMSFSPSGTQFVTVSTDGTSNILNVPVELVAQGVFPADIAIGGAIYADNGRVLIGGGDDGRIHVVDAKDRRLLATSPTGHARSIIDLVASADDSLFATLGQDQLIRLWTYGIVRPLSLDRRVADGAAKGLAVSPDGRLLAAGASSGVVTIWDQIGAQEPTTMAGHNAPVWALAFSSSGTLIASGDRSGEVRIWDATTGSLRRIIRVAHEAVWSVQFAPNEKRLFVAGNSGVSAWTIGEGIRVQAYQRDGANVTRAKLSSDGTMLGVSYTDGYIYLWNVADASKRAEIKVGDDIVWSLAFSPDQRSLATALGSEVVATWDIASGTRKNALTGHTGGATDVGFLADGVTLVVVDRSGNLHWWDLRSGRRLVDAWRAHQRPSWRLALYPNGQQVVTAGDDGRVRSWDPMNVDTACDLGRHAFDDERRSQYLGQSEHLQACDHGQSR